MFAFAGLWETWHAGQDDELFTFTVITTDANQAMSAIHKRMPVILDPGEYSAWLGPGADTVDLLPLLKPYSGHLELYQVNRTVNSPKEKGAWLVNKIKQA